MVAHWVECVSQRARSLTCINTLSHSLTLHLYQHTHCFSSNFIRSCLQEQSGTERQTGLVALIDIGMERQTGALTQTDTGRYRETDRCSNTDRHRQVQRDRQVL